MVFVSIYLIDLINIREPPLSIVCNKTNTDNIRILKASKDYLYIISENELLRINVNKKKEAQLFFVGTLLQISEAIIQMQVESWKNSIVIVARTGSFIYVYLTQNNFNVAVDLEPIQKISTNSPSDHFVFFHNAEDLILLLYNVKNDADNEMV